MTGNLLWGVLGITALSLLGFAFLASGGLLHRVPARFRGYVSAGGWILLFLFLANNLHKAFFRENGLVANGTLSEGWAWVAWGALSAALAVSAIYRIVQALKPPGHKTGTGTSA